jgi:hypothetical protein
MSDDVRIQFDSAGFKALLESDGVCDLVTDTAEDIAQRANANGNTDGFATSVMRGGYGGGRWIAFAKSTTAEATKAEAEEKALTRALQE